MLFSYVALCGWVAVGLTSLGSMELPGEFLPYLFSQKQGFPCMNAASICSVVPAL